jgi:uncharacterized repeat protein (TIGR02543 family)
LIGSCNYNNSATIQTTSGEVVAALPAVKDKIDASYVISGASGDVELKLGGTFYVHSIRVIYDSDDSVTAKEETTNFKTKSSGATFTGVQLVNMDGDGKGHGLLTASTYANTMILNLASYANVVVETCAYNAGSTSDSVAASSGEVSYTCPGNETNNGNVDGTYTIKGAEAGKLFLNFNKNMYIHSVTVEYVNKGDVIPERQKWDFSDTSEENVKALYEGTDVKTYERETGTYKLLKIDATKGKFYPRKDSQDVQVNSGTIIKVPVKNGNNAITVRTSNENVCKVGGTALTSKEQTVYCNATDGYITIEMTANDYISLIEVEFGATLTYVSAGIINFVNTDENSWDGLRLTNIVVAEEKSNGLSVRDEGGAITFHLNSSMNIAITTTDASPSVVGEATTSTYGVSEYADGVYTINAVTAGDLKIDFNAGKYISKIEITAYTTPSDKLDAETDMAVWDFGGQDSVTISDKTYSNNLTKTDVEKFPGSPTSIIINSTDSEKYLEYYSPQAKTVRIYAQDTSTITGSMPGKYVSDEYKGAMYVDSKNPAIYLAINAKAGDIVTVRAAGNNGASKLGFQNLNDTSVAIDYQIVAQSGGDATFYVKKDGKYSIFSSDEKLVVLRITREHTKKLEVTGTVTLNGENFNEGNIIFKNRSTSVETPAAISNGQYSVTLNAKYMYDISIDLNQYVIKGDAVLDLTKDGEHKQDIELEEISRVTVSGSIEGLDADSLGYLKLEFVNEASPYEPVIEINKDVNPATYTAVLEKDAVYTLKAVDVDDYDFSSDTDTANVSFSAAGTKNIKFTEKEKHKVTIVPDGATPEALSSAEFVFTKLSVADDGNVVLDDKSAAVKDARSTGDIYTYTFEGTDNINLRDGVYKVEVKNSGDYVQQLTSNLKVNGGDVSKVISFKSDITEWKFSDKAFETAAANKDTTAETWNYQGLILDKSIGKNKSYALGSSGEIKIPVKSTCDVTVKYCYHANAVVGDKEFTINVENTDEHSVIYRYTGNEEGYVTITLNGETYLNSIRVDKVEEYKDVITVGDSDCDYTTINDALEAVRKMDRTDSQNVTISIKPGDYEEMLVIDVNNVALVNAAGDNASISLTNNGVNIAANAVRITSYYGHGYTYYSMGSDCKYDADLLAANKENGYPSKVNPGAGTTDGSYWNATVVISGNNVSAEGIIFENSFNQYVSKKAAEDIIVAQDGNAKEGSVARASMKYGDTTVQDKAYVERAAALAIDNKCSNIYFENCKFVGRQDTLYGGAETTAAFYKCSIYGGTDYICGGMAAVFAKCDLVFNTSENSNDVGYITASQTNANNKYPGARGYLMYNCHVTSTIPGADTVSEKTSKPGYFGRPWSATYGEAVFYETIVDKAADDWSTLGASLIMPAGWSNALSGTSDYSYEYGTIEKSGVDNSGNRASWSKVLTETQLESAKLNDPATFLGTWNPFEGKDMALVTDCGNTHNTVAGNSEGSGNQTTKATVTFNSNGGSAVDAITVDKGSRVTKPADPTKEGFTFAGWFKEDTLATQFDFDSETVSADITLYAKWDAVNASATFTVTFNTNGGSDVPVQQIAQDGKVVKPETDPTREGYTFAGWFKDADCTIAFDFETEVITADTTIYAKWEEVKSEEPEPEPVAPKGEGLKIKFSNGTQNYDEDYTGSAITPAIVVTNNGEALTEGTDYTVKYSNNVNVTNSARITVTGKGQISGTYVLYFTINAVKLNSDRIKISQVPVIAGQKVSPVVIDRGTQLKLNKDFEFADSKYDTYKFDSTSTETYVIINGIGNYTGNYFVPVKLVDKRNAKKFKADITAKDTLVYNGKAHEFEVSVTDASTGEKLPDGSYTVSYSDVTNAGTVKVAVTASYIKEDGTYYAGTVTKSFKISPLKAVSSDFTVNLDKKSYDYVSTGTTVSGLSIVYKSGDTSITLTEGRDYTLSYSNNKKVGSAQCKITFIGNFKGSKADPVSFEITAATLNNSSKNVKAVAADKIFKKEGIYKSAPYVTVDGVLVKSSEYTVTYYIQDANGNRGEEMNSSNKVTKGGTTIQAVIKGKEKGNYSKLEYTCTYKVQETPADAIDISKAKVVLFDEEGKKTTTAEYTGEEIGSETISVKLKIGKKYVDAGKVAKCDIQYLNNVNTGKATIVINGDGVNIIGSKTASFKITAKKISK